MTEASAPPPGVPAGWYPDPDKPGTQRYWDGSSWTEQLAPLPVESPVSAIPPKTATGWGWARIVSALAALGIIIGSIGPWATSALESVAGTEGDGKITVWAGVIALVIVGFRRAVLLNVIIGILVGLEALSRIGSVNDYSVHAFGQEIHPASVGWGLWLMAVSCAALIVGSWFFYDEAKQYWSERKVDGEIDKEEKANG